MSASKTAQSDTLQAQTALAKAELEHGRAIGGYDKARVALLVALGLQSPPSLQDPQRPTEDLVLAPDYEDDGVALRQDLTEWLRLAQQYVLPGGVAICMLGPSDEVPAQVEDLALKQELGYALPFSGAQRRLAIYQHL